MSFPSLFGFSNLSGDGFVYRVNDDNKTLIIIHTVATRAHTRTSLQTMSIKRPQHPELAHAANILTTRKSHLSGHRGRL